MKDLVTCQWHVAQDLLALSFALFVLWEQHEFRGDYEATDVGSWSCVDSNVPVRNESL